VSDIEEWSKKGLEVMKGFEEEFMKVEKEGERVGWMKVCFTFLSFLTSSACSTTISPASMIAPVLTIAPDESFN